MSHDGPSKMDIADQRAMYDTFWSYMIRTAVFIAIVLLFLLAFVA